MAKIHPRAEFEPLLQGFAHLIQANAESKKRQDQDWLVYGQTMLLKAFRHVESIHRLSTPVQTKIAGKATDGYVDHSSIAVLARAAFETFALFHFIFCCGSIEERQLKQHLWRLIGLRERQRLQLVPLNRGAQIADEAKRADALEKLILAHPEFQKLEKRRQDKALKDLDVKMGYRWTELAEMAGFPRRYAHDMYKHLCNYAHSNAQSAWQIHDAIIDGTHRDMAAVVISFCTFLLTKVIRSYADLFEVVKAALEKDLTTSALVEMWEDLKPEMDKNWA